jgi:hypothetical protein
MNDAVGGLVVGDLADASGQGAVHESARTRNPLNTGGAASATPVSLPGFHAADGPLAGVPDILIEVPAGERIPAVFYETDVKPAPQQKMLDRIAAEFNETVSNPPPGVPEIEIWEQARRRADEQYLLLYGHAAYTARHLEAAREAVREKRAVEAAGQRQDATDYDTPEP